MGKPGGTVHNGDTGHGLGDGARGIAVGDDQSGSLVDSHVSKAFALAPRVPDSHRSHGVGLASVGDLGGSRAVGGVGSHELSGIDWLGTIVVSRSTGHEGSRDHGGTHFSCCCCC